MSSVPDASPQVVQRGRSSAPCHCTRLQAVHLRKNACHLPPATGCRLAMRRVILSRSERTCSSSPAIQCRAPLAHEKHAETDKCNTRSLAPVLPQLRQRDILLWWRCHASARIWANSGSRSAVMLTCAPRMCMVCRMAAPAPSKRALQHRPAPVSGPSAHLHLLSRSSRPTRPAAAFLGSCCLTLPRLSDKPTIVWPRKAAQTALGNVEPVAPLFP